MTKKISELLPATTLDSTEYFPVVQSGSTIRSTLKSVLARVHLLGIGMGRTKPAKNDRQPLFQLCYDDTVVGNYTKYTSTSTLSFDTTLGGFSNRNPPVCQIAKLQKGINDKQSYIEYNVTPGQDLANTVMTAWIYIYSGSENIQGTTGISVFPSSDSGVLTNYYRFNFNPCSSDVLTDNHLYKCSWDMASPDGTGGTLNTADIKKIRFQVTTVNNADACTWGAMRVAWFARPTGNPRIALTMDDAEGRQLNPIALANAMGIPITLYVPTSKIGTTGFLTWDQLKGLHEGGCLIANHSHNHVWWTDTATLQERVEDYCEAIQDLSSYGFSDGAYHFALPGAYGQFKHPLGFAQGDVWDMFETIRLSDGGLNDPGPNRIWNTICFEELNDATSLANFKAAVDDTIAQKRYAVFGTHVTGYNAANWYEALDYLDGLRGSVDLHTIATIGN